VIGLANVPARAAHLAGMSKILFFTAEHLTERRDLRKMSVPRQSHDDPRLSRKCREMPRGISRVDSAKKRQHSWLARYYAADRIITKQFADGRYGSKEKAFKAAQEWLAEQKKIHPARRSQLEYAPFQLQKPRSNTGILGISRTYDYARHDKSIKQECFAVAYSDQGVRGCKKFYIHHYVDEQEALADSSPNRAAGQWR
jgi:hypothetical protein